MEIEQNDSTPTELLLKLGEHMHQHALQCQKTSNLLVEAAGLFAESVSKAALVDFSNKVGEIGEAARVSLGQIIENSLRSKGFSVFGRVGGIELAMEITGKSKSTIYHLTSQGKMPYTKNGGQLQFSELALRAYTFTPDAPVVNTSGFDCLLTPLPALTSTN